MRDRNVTGVQTCALPICDTHEEAKKFFVNYFKQIALVFGGAWNGRKYSIKSASALREIGRASCRERVKISVVAVSIKKNRIRRHVAQPLERSSPQCDCES